VSAPRKQSIIGFEEGVNSIRKSLCQLRVLLFSDPVNPDREVKLEGPYRIIIEERSIAVPTITRIKGINSIQMIFVEFPVNAYAVFDKKG
jgi:hypothetical protein